MVNKNSSLNESISINQRISNIHRFLMYLVIIVNTGGVAYFVLLDIFYRGKAMDSAFEAFLFYWTLAFVPTSIAYAIVEIKYKRKYSSIS